MTRNDDTILELLADAHPLAVPPKVIEWNANRIPGSASLVDQTVTNRLKMLCRSGLVEKVREAGGYYQITSDGLRYLAGKDKPADLS